MSTRPAIIALLITLLLAVAAYFVLKPPSGPATGSSIIDQGERLLTLDPATLQAITLTVPPAQPQVIDHNADGRWYWRSSPTSTRIYALDDSRARALIRLLAESKGVAAPQNSRPLPESPSPIKLTLHGPDGDTTLRLSPRALGGQVLVDVATPGLPTPRPAVINDDLLTVLTSPGPSAWRDTRALTGDPAQAARITFTDGTGKTGFGLARRDGQWFVTPPAAVTAPAENDPVAAVLKTLDSLNIARFYDEATQPTAQAAGLDKPTAILTLEYDDRSIDPATQKPVTATRTLKLLFGQPADTEGTTLYTSADGGKTIFAVSALPLTKLTAPASNLVMRAATRTPAADVGSIEFASPAPSSRALKLARDGVTGRWSETLDTATPITQDPTKAATSESILAFFTRIGADTVSFDAPSASDARLTATVTLSTPSGQPLDKFEVLIPTSGGSLIVRSGSIYRGFSKPPDELVRWLAVLSR